MQNAPNKCAVVRILREHWCSRNHGAGGLLTEWCQGRVIFSANFADKPYLRRPLKVNDVNPEVAQLGTNMLFPGCTLHIFGRLRVEIVRGKKLRCKMYGTWRCQSEDVGLGIFNIIQYILQCRTSIPTKKTTWSNYFVPAQVSNSALLQEDSSDVSLGLVLLDDTIRKW